MIQFIIYLVLTISGLTLFKLGSSGVDISLSFKQISVNISSIAIMGMMCYLASFLLWLNILKNNDLGVIFPIATGIVTVLTFLVGIAIFNETVTITKIIAVIFIVLGVIIMNLKL